jgi:hypothetical protein
MTVFGASQRVIHAYRWRPGAARRRHRGGLNARAPLIHSGEGTTMRSMKAGMALAAICAAMLSTMIVKRKRQGRQGRRPRA